MLVKIMNVSSFHGQFVNTLKIYFESKFYSDAKERKEGGIELSGFIVDEYPEFAELRSGDIIDINIEIEKKLGAL
jgi:hypothetical protein